MEVQYIYTFESMQQEYVNSAFTAIKNLSVNDFLDHAADPLTNTEKANLVKISCCVICDKEELPEWYIEANGKLWFEEIEAWRKLKGIKGTTVEEY